MPSIDQLAPTSDGEQTRTVWNIVCSCLFTIFLCTWGSLHPNISSTPDEPGAGWFKKQVWKPFLGVITYKLPLLLWALLVPEYILAWAIRQYIMAGVIRRKGELLPLNGHSYPERLQFQTGREHTDFF
jgi:hypothetical protein